MRWKRVNKKIEERSLIDSRPDWESIRNILLTSVNGVKLSMSLDGVDIIGNDQKRYNALGEINAEPQNKLSSTLSKKYKTLVTLDYSSDPLIDLLDHANDVFNSVNNSLFYQFPKLSAKVLSSSKWDKGAKLEYFISK